MSDVDPGQSGQDHGQDDDRGRRPTDPDVTPADTTEEPLVEEPTQPAPTDAPLPEPANPDDPLENPDPAEGPREDPPIGGEATPDEPPPE